MIAVKTGRFARGTEGAHEDRNGRERPLTGAGIRLPALRAGDPAVHRLLRRVMTAAKHRMPALRARRCAAELIPVDGGCVLLITPGGRVPDDAPWLYRAADISALLALAAHLRGYPWEQPCSTLYAVDGGYLLLLSPPAPGVRPPIVEEYLTHVGDGAVAAAVAAEHGRLLFAGDALEHLSGKLPHRD